MKYKIASRNDVFRYSLHPHKERALVISATDKYSPPAKILQNPQYNGIMATKRVKFDDVSLGRPNCITKEDAKEIAKFIKRHKDSQYDLLIVNCEVGVCRSAGICAAIMRYMGHDYKQLFASKTFKPNIGCFKLLCEALGVQVSPKELEELRALNKQVWDERTKRESKVFAMHALKSVSAGHIIRQLNMFITEHFFF